MWYRIMLNIRREFHIAKMNIIRRWRLDTPLGVVGIITVLSAFAFFIFIFKTIAMIIRSSIPWVTGSAVGALYWNSVTLALKFSFVFVLFSGSLVLYFILKIHSRR